MANINVKFNNKDYLLSCDDGQEESLKKLTIFLDKKYNELRDQLGEIGENKLLLITTIKLIDDYFNLKQKVTLQKNNLDDTPYNLDDVVLIHGLKNEDYNNQTAYIKQYNPETLRYEIDLNDMDKTISIKEDNFRLSEQDTSTGEISKEQ